MNPLFSIWLKPRITIRQLIKSDPERYVLLLAVLAGLARVLKQAIDNTVGQHATLPVILIICLIVGAIVGLVSLYFGATVLQWVSGQFGGQGSALAYRTVIAWAGVPLVASLLISVVQVTLVGHSLFVDIGAILETGGGLGITLSILDWSITVLSLWAIVLLVMGLAEVGKVADWLALVLAIVPFYIASVMSSIIVSVLVLVR